MGIKSYVKDGQKLFLIQVKTRDKNGKQVYRSRQAIKTKREAERIEFELKKTVEAEISGRPKTTWDCWFDHAIALMKLERKASTWINYEANLNKWITPIWPKKDIGEISKADVQRAIFELIPEGAVSPNTRKTILKQLRRVLQMAVEENVLDRNPATGVTVAVPEPEKKVFAHAEVEKFLTQAKICDHRFYPIWVMALMTGMRSGEMFALDWDNVELENRIIRVTRQWTNKDGFKPTKTKRSRVVPISDELLLFLKEWRLKADTESKFVLPHLKEWENGEQALVTKEFCRAIGVTQIKFHDLRATFITNLLAQGVPLAQVMAIVGHSQIKTTNEYLRLAGVEVKGATDNLSYSLPTENGAQVLRPVFGGRIDA